MDATRKDNRIYGCNQEGEQDIWMQLGGRIGYKDGARDDKETRKEDKRI